MSVIDSEMWLEAIKYEMDSIGSNKVLTLVHPPKGVKPVGCKLVYEYKFGADRKITTFKVGLMENDTLNDPGLISRKPIRP